MLSINTFLLFAVVTTTIGRAKSQASPCPLYKPSNGASCNPREMTRSCRYEAFACPNSTSIAYLSKCHCDSATSTFICRSNDPAPQCEPPSREDPCPKSSSLSYNGGVCPFPENYDGPRVCNYDPYECPGRVGDGIFTTQCKCGGKGGVEYYDCLIIDVFPCSFPAHAPYAIPPIPIPPTRATECPLIAPDIETLCDPNAAIGRCRYDAFACNGDSKISFNTYCECASNGRFECTTDSPPFDLCPTREVDDCPLESPLVEPVEDCSFVNPDKKCNYNPFGCPGTKDAGDFITRCTCNDDGQFICSQQAEDCSKKETPPVFDICFAGNSLIDVQGKGVISMDQLAIGDKVLVDHDNLVYEPVYSFGHFGPDTRAEFLEIRTSSTDQPSLKLSSDHMVMLAGQETFVCASSLQMGDALVDAVHGKDAIIQSIKTIAARGVYAPFTPSGRLIVNGIMVSSFVAMGYPNSFFFSWQWLAHTFEFPHRVSCYYLGSCPDEMYTERGISRWVAIPHDAGQWITRQTAVPRSILMGLCLVVLGTFFILERALFGPARFIVMAGLAIAAYSHRIRRPAKAHLSPR